MSQRPGRLFYLVGPSGAGKDSLLDYIKTRVPEEAVHFPRRYIPRPASAGGEAHITISVSDFKQKLSEGFFSLWWESHGNFYGLSSEMDDWLAAGRPVALNGSRGYMPTALKSYPDMVTILVDVSNETLRKRLIGRRRETVEQIEKRLLRNDEFRSFEAPNLIRLDNNRPLKQSGEELLRIILG